MTHFDGCPIADDGTFAFNEAVRIDFRHLVAMKFAGEAGQVRGQGGGAAAAELAGRLSWRHCLRPYTHKSSRGLPAACLRPV